MKLRNFQAELGQQSSLPLSRDVNFVLGALSPSKLWGSSAHSTCVGKQDLREDGVLDSISAVLDLGHIPELCSPDEITNMPAQRILRHSTWGCFG